MADVLTHILVAIAVAGALVAAVLAVLRRERIRGLATADAARRLRRYRLQIIELCVWAVLVPPIVLASAELSAADIGWAWPRIGGDEFTVLGWATAVAWPVGVLLGGLARRLRVRRGDALPARADALLVPRTASERGPAAAAFVTAGIVEEVIYRGLLIGVGTQLYHLPLPLVVVVSLALFVAVHAYQGRRGMLGVALLGAILTAVYLATGSLLLAVVVHVCHNLVALLVIPADSQPARDPAGTLPTPAVPPTPSTPAPAAPLVRSAVPDDL